MARNVAPDDFAGTSDGIPTVELEAADAIRTPMQLHVVRQHQARGTFEQALKRR